MNLIEKIRVDLNRPQTKNKFADLWRVAIDEDAPGTVRVCGPSFRVFGVTTATDLSGEDWIARHADARRIARVPEMEAALLAADELAKAVIPVSYIHRDVIEESRARRDEAYGNDNLMRLRALYFKARMNEKDRLDAALSAYRQATGAE